jgi:hypothetical protein
VPKIKVVEFFKLYKNALGLKFKNSKLAVLLVEFLNRVKFKSPMSLPSKILIKFLTYLQTFMGCHDGKYFYK